MTRAVTAIALDRPRAVAERAPFVEGLFLATVFSVTFAKLQWEVAGTLSFSDVVTALFLLAFVVYRARALRRPARAGGSRSRSGSSPPSCSST